MAEVTKNKLKKFEYKVPQDDTSDVSTTKTEAAVAADKTTNPDGSKTAATPMNRLTWKDFMEPAGSADREPDVSPHDRVMWDSKPDDRYSSVLSPVMPRRNRKRARSSSPASSPAADKTKTPAVNVKKLSQALKSPHADPTLELWDRYSHSKNETQATPVGLANPALAQLVVSSSPRPAGHPPAGNGPGSLRRAVSHGLHGLKRRRLEKSRSCSGGGSSQREMEAASKSSLVTQLLDTVNSSIQEPSPGEPAEPLGSPSPRKVKRISPTEATPCRPGVQRQEPPAIAELEDVLDYCDDDFDDDDFMELEASINGPQQLEPKLLPESEHQSANKADPGMDIDSLDGDTFGPTGSLVADAAAVPKLEPHLSTQTANTDPGKENVLDDLEDEFGDLEDDDIDFDAVEMAATQAVQQAQSSTQAVRWR